MRISTRRLTASTLTALLAGCAGRGDGPATAAPDEANGDAVRVLVLTATHSWRHHEAIDASREALQGLAETTGFAIRFVDDLDELDAAALAEHDVLLLNQASLRAAPHRPGDSTEPDTYTIGVAESADRTLPGQLVIEGEPGSFAGFIAIAESDRIPLDGVRLDGDRLRFAFEHPTLGPAEADARTRGVGLEGTLRTEAGEMRLTGNRYAGAGRHLGVYEPVSEAQRAAILDFVARGGGLAVTHAGLDAFFDWPEYRELVGGGLFQEHPWVQSVRIRVEDAVHPAVAHLGEGFDVHDEIYVLDRNPRGAAHVLLSLDTASVDLALGPSDGRAHDYPISWARRHGEGRVFVTSLGHFPEVWRRAEFLEHVVQGIRYAAGRLEVAAD